MFGAGTRDADRVAFLEGVAAHEMGRHLARDADERNGIHERVGEPGDGVRGAGPRRDQQHPAFAGGSRVPLGCMGGALLVPHQDMLDLLLLKKLVVDRQDRASGITENMFNALIRQGF